MEEDNLFSHAGKIEALSREIVRHNQLYWENNTPEISDADYDKLVESLRALAPSHPLLNAIYTPEVISSGKVRHASPMLSLDKAYSLQAVLEWAGKYARTPDELLLVEPKYDGISANFDGRILATRGDGESGENISDKLPLLELEAPGYRGKPDRPARGEIVIREDDFRTVYANIRRKDGGVYKNPRNAVAGIMGLKEIDLMLAQKAKLTLVDYNLISIQVKLSELSSRWESLLEDLEKLPYPRDGVVIKFADRQFRDSLGNTAHHPRGEIAYKYSNVKRETRLLDVEWSFGKNNLTPVAIMEPVEFDGVTVKRATLHNVQNIIDMDLHIGDHITVERAGDVIPYISASTPGEGERISPMINCCPVCDADLERRGPELVCPNPECPGTGLQRLSAAVKALDVENLGESTLKKLTAVCGVRHLSDLFQLKAADLLKVEGFAAKSASNLLNELQRVRTLPEWQLLAALNIPNVGPNIAKLLLADHTFAELRQASADELSSIPGVGPERAKALTTAFAGRKEEIDELCDALTLVRENAGAGERPTVCFTGKMPEKRSFYAALAEKRGYAVADSVNRQLTLLVAADVNDSSSKLVNARKAGIKIISLEEFMAEGTPESRNNTEVEQPDLF